MRLLFLLVLVFFSVISCGQNSDRSLLESRFENSRFPIRPDEKLTPGTLCDHADTYRYPSHVAYCVRDVGSDEKKAVIELYDERLGFHIRSMNRASLSNLNWQ